MPYVNESDFKASKPHKAGTLPVSQDWGVQPLRTVSRSQYGWRSAGEQKASREALAAIQKGATWSDTTSVIAALDRVERSMSSPLIRDPSNLPVHNRDYVESVSDGSPSVGTLGDRNKTPVWTITSLHKSDISRTPALPTESEIRTRGGDQLRASRPAAPSSNLFQWFGELRQFGDLTSVPTDIPKSVWERPGIRGEIERFRRGGQAAGSAHLAGQFGWLPFVGELFNVLGAIGESERILDQYLRDSGKLVKRSRSDTLVADAVTVNHGTSGTNAIGSWGSSTFSGLGVQGSVLSMKGYGNSNYRFRYQTTISRKLVQRSGALWEYFAADPDRVLGKLRRRAQESKAILGDPLLSLSTLWELAPWSWLADWRFDFGSLLSFQESVATDSLAARRSYTILEEDVQVHTRVEPWYSTKGSWVYQQTTPGNGFASRRTQIRRAGSPYDMGINWSGFSTQQWFILGALGLTKAPGIPG